MNSQRLHSFCIVFFFVNVSVYTMYYVFRFAFQPRIFSFCCIQLGRDNMPRIQISKYVYVCEMFMQLRRIRQL